MAGANQMERKCNLPATGNYILKTTHRENKANNPYKAQCNTEHCVKISGGKSLSTQSKPENNFSRRSEILPNLISLLEIAGNMSVRDTSTFKIQRLLKMWLGVKIKVIKLSK